VYDIDTVPGMTEHPDFWPGRNYRDRPNVSSLLDGKGGGSSLLLTGHMDTVVLGDNVWTRDPFGAETADGKMYGLGTIDMKGPMGAMLVLYVALAKERIPLRGALSFESVVDEEEGGVNATIAGRLRHGPMDAALIPEGTNLEIYPAARGALITEYLFKSGKGTWLEVGMSGEPAADAVEQVGYFLTHIHELQASRLKHPVHPLYTVYPNPVPVQVTKVYAGGWGSGAPIAVPPEGRIQTILQTLPGEKYEDVQAEHDAWFESLLNRYPQVFSVRPETTHGIRWMVPTAIEADHPLVKTMERAAQEVLGQPPKVVGAPYACDMFALHQLFNMPGIIFGPTGANAHAADEYVELDSLFKYFEALALFVMEWCGVGD